MSAALAIVEPTLPSLVDRAANALASARTSAEVLDARDRATFAYDTAKLAARLAAAKGAHDSLIAAAHRAQAHALEIEAGAKRRLADEYDAAQERGEVRGAGGDRSSKIPDGKFAHTEIGLTGKQVHEARQIRDAEVADPGIVRRTLDDRLAAGEEPSKAALRAAVVDTVSRGWRAPSSAQPRHVSVKDPQFDAFLTVKDCARQIAEMLAQHGLNGLRAGCHDDAMMTRALPPLRDGHAALTTILEAFDAS